MSSDRPTVIATGIEPIDDAIGGFELGSAHVVYGERETGKTTLALQFIVEGLRRGQTCALVVRYKPEDAISRMKAFGYDCLPDLGSGKLLIIEYADDLVDQLAETSDLETILAEFERMIDRDRPQRVAFDSADFIFSIQMGYGYPLLIGPFLNWFSNRNAMTLLVVEERMGERIAQTFRAHARTVIQALKRKLLIGTQYYFAFEKGLVRAPQRRVDLTDRGFSTVEVVDTHGKTLPLPTSPAPRAMDSGLTGQLTVPADAALALIEAAVQSLKQEEQQATKARDAGKKEAPKRTGRPRVLVIDPDTAIHKLVDRALSPDCDVVGESDGVAGLGKAKDFDADLVILDLEQTIFDGFTICRQIRASSTVPILVATGSRTRSEDRISSAEAGADQFLIKPFSLRELTIRSRQLIARYRGQPVPSSTTGDLNRADPLVTFEQFLDRFALQTELLFGIGNDPVCSVLSCRLETTVTAETSRAIDAVRGDLKAEEFMAYDPESQRLIALLAQPLASAREFAQTLARRIETQNGLKLEFQAAAIDSEESARRFREQLSSPPAKDETGSEARRQFLEFLQ